MTWRPLSWPLALLIASTTTSFKVSPPDTGNAFAISKRQSDPARAVVGASDGEVCERLSLHRLQDNADQWTLYLLALDSLKGQNQNATLSYYDVAKVHGLPAVPWDGVQGQWIPGQRAPGFCAHQSGLFMGWHRVYMALHEQTVLASARKVIDTFSGDTRTRYEKALHCLRVPYWDWAEGPGKEPTVVPGALSTREITLPAPNGTNRTVPNPLYRYDFHPLDSAGFAMPPWDSWPQTLRYPNTTDTTNAVSQDNLMVSAIQNIAQSLHDQVYNIFTQCNEFQMLTDNAQLAGGCSQGLEGVHDTIHNTLGGLGEGHMSILWISSYDPIFWLHHANCDRLFAIWQVLYPDSFVGPGTLTMGTYSQPEGTRYDADSPLEPFHRSNGSSWTSNTVRDVHTFQYTYTELVQANGSASAMRGIVNSLYGKSPAQSHHAGKRHTATSQPLPKDSDVLLRPTEQHVDYSANIVVERFGLNGSFNIYLFLGHPRDCPTADHYAHASNLIGVMGVFANPGMTMSKVLARGALPLTLALVAAVHRGELPSLDAAPVSRYLKDQMQWRIVKSCGGQVPVQDVPGLCVSIVRSQVTYAASDNDFPTWRAFETMAELTQDLREMEWKMLEALDSVMPS